MFRTIAFCLSFCLFAFSGSYASETNIPRTGQTTSYATGDDGAIQAGVHLPTPRFSAANGAVTDNLTGLAWLQNADCFGSMPWYDALATATYLADGFCDLTDGSTYGQWRLPTRLELESLVDTSRNNPALPAGHPFNSVANGSYWSSSTFAPNTDYAWSVTMSAGNLYGLVLGSDKNSAYYAWPVRDGAASGTAKVAQSGQTASYASGDDGELKPGVAWPANRFTSNGNGTVTDNLTGLIWLQKANCFGASPWANALSSVSSLANGFCGLTEGSAATDWRLPSRKELQSLVDASRYFPPLPAGHPFTGVMDYLYWTSTTFAGNSANVWFVDMYDGHLGNNDKSNGLFMVWPVRGGQFGNATSLVLPDHKDFGMVSVGNSATQNFTISNSAGSGSSRLQINAIALRGTDADQFSIDPGNGSGGSCGSLMPILSPGASCTVAVRFQPASSTGKTATLRVSGSDATRPNADIPLTGNEFYIVTGSVSGGNGTISSLNPLSIVGGVAATFTVSPAEYYQPSPAVGGTCAAGSWSGNQYTISTITADCTVVFSFVRITFPLTITFAGSGSGTVVVLPKPPASDCTGSCSQSFDAGTDVTLTPAPDGSSAFSGWNSCPSLSGTVCTVNMTAAQSLTVTFSPLSAAGVKVGSTLYGTIAAGYAAVADAGEVSLKSGDIPELVDLDRLIAFTLKGGYSSDFLSVTGTTAISGSLTVSAGTVTLDNITFR